MIISVIYLYFPQGPPVIPVIHRLVEMQEFAWRLEEAGIKRLILSSANANDHSLEQDVKEVNFITAIFVYNCKISFF
jgi:hypothetical protein